MLPNQYHLLTMISLLPEAEIQQCVYPQEYRFHRKWGYSYYFMPGCDNKNESGKIKRILYLSGKVNFLKMERKGCNLLI